MTSSRSYTTLVSSFATMLIDSLWAVNSMMFDSLRTLTHVAQMLRASEWKPLELETGSSATWGTTKTFSCHRLCSSSAEAVYSFYYLRCHRMNSYWFHTLQILSFRSREWPWGQFWSFHSTLTFSGFNLHYFSDSIVIVSVQSWCILFLNICLMFCNEQNRWC